MKTRLSVPLSVLVSTLSLFPGSPAQAQDAFIPFTPKDERKFLGPRYEGRLIPMEHAQQMLESDSDPLILIHGRSGSIKNFAHLVLNTPKLTSEYQLYYFAYDDLHRSLKRSAQDLAVNILKLRAPRVTLIAHSMGGLIARETLNYLAKAGLGDKLPEIRVISVDSPWQGGSALGCERKGNLDNMVEYFLPAALTDMRSCSDFFHSLYSVSWPNKFSMELYFAEQGAQAKHQMESPLNKLPEKIANLFSENIPMTGSLYEMNFWNAISTSSQYPAFVNELSALHEHSKITTGDVQGLLEKHFPRFPGDHASVLSAHPSSERDLPKYLQTIL